MIADDFDLLDKAAPELKKSAKEKALDKELEREFHQREQQALFFLIDFKKSIQASARARIKTVEDLDRFEKTYLELLPQIDMFIDCFETAAELTPEVRIQNYIAVQKFICVRIYPIFKRKIEKGGESK
ncbi:hypothetical protein ABGT22_19615 [Peribacillus frigoritolerans]|uniref:hypothetical protein n=1 Tax=Peribacillus frigoritolerans TaxID=450367 RepID=UPI00345DE614